MNVLGIIPARGGSKGIPNKCLVDCAGQPLIDYTLEAAVESEALTHVVLSSDSAEIIAHVQSRAPSIQTLQRPDALATDNTPMLPVMQHVLESIPADIIVLLQPTSPLRQAAHIDEAIQLFRQSTADTLVSVTPVPHGYNPESLQLLGENNDLLPLTEETVFSRQNKKQYYARNGPAIVVTRPKQLTKKSLYEGECLGYRMSALDSIDIDEPDDLLMAKSLIYLKKNQLGA